MWNSIKVAGTILNWLWIDATAWLSTSMTARGELMYCIRQSVCVCVCMCVWRGGRGASSLSWLEKWFAWKCGTSVTNCACIAHPLFFFFLHNLAGSAANLSLHICIDMFSCSQGMNSSFTLENGEVKMKKNHQVFTFHMAALDSLLFDSVPRQT